MMTRFDVLSGNDTLADAVRLTIDTHQRDFPVDLGDGRLALLTQKDLMLAMRSHEDDVALSAFNLPTLMQVSPDKSAEDILQALQSQRLSLCAVMQGNSLLGLVSTDNLMEYISLHTQARA
jgi:CBS domain containing-hemolysin-like protein